MTAVSTNFMPLDRHFFQHTIGEALGELARQRYPRDTAKRLAKAWDIALPTAENVVKGHASERTLTKALRAEGWPLIAAIGQAVTGESFHQFEERRLQVIINEADHARQKLVDLRARREELDARPDQLDHLRTWSPAEHRGDGGR